MWEAHQGLPALPSLLFPCPLNTSGLPSSLQPPQKTFYIPNSNSAPATSTMSFCNTTATSCGSLAVSPDSELLVLSFTVPHLIRTSQWLKDTSWTFFDKS